MLQSIHLSQRFIKQLRALEKSDKKGILAAAQTELILSHYRNAGEETEEVKAKRTRHGESRLRNCLKYDLGGGYRLIIFREGEQLLFTFVGNHDDTDLWLERNRGTGFVEEMRQGPFETIPMIDRLEKSARILKPDTIDDRDDYEEELQRRLDDKTLRQVFGSFYSP